MPSYKLYKNATVTHRSGGRIPHVTNSSNLKITGGSQTAKQKKTAYAQTLLDPFKYKGVRIPDLACYPTAIYQSEQTIRWVPAYDVGNAPIGLSSTAMVIDLTANPQYQLLYGVESASRGTRRTGGPSSSALPPAHKGYFINSASTKFSRGRLVSAGIIVEYCGNDTQSQGTITILAESGNTNDANLATNIDVPVAWFDNPSQQRQVFQGPLRDGARAIYRPLDASSFDMKGIAAPTCFGQFVVFLSGMNLTGTAPQQVGPEFLIHVVANFEGQMNDASSGAVEEAFAMDIDGFQHGLTVVSGAQSCTAGDTETLARKTAEADDVGRLPPSLGKKVSKLRGKAPGLRSLASMYKRKK